MRVNSQVVNQGHHQSHTFKPADSKLHSVIGGITNEKKARFRNGADMAMSRVVDQLAKNNGIKNTISQKKGLCAVGAAFGLTFIALDPIIMAGLVVLPSLAIGASTAFDEPNLLPKEEEDALEINKIVLKDFPEACIPENPTPEEKKKCEDIYKKIRPIAKELHEANMAYAAKVAEIESKFRDMTRSSDDDNHTPHYHVFKGMTLSGQFGRTEDIDWEKWRKDHLVSAKRDFEKVTDAVSTKFKDLKKEIDATYYI